MSTVIKINKKETLISYLKKGITQCSFNESSIWLLAYASTPNLIYPCILMKEVIFEIRLYSIVSISSTQDYFHMLLHISLQTYILMKDVTLKKVYTHCSFNELRI